MNDKCAVTMNHSNIALPAVASNEDLRELLESLCGSEGLDYRDLDFIKVPPGGGSHFTIPGASGDEMRPDLTGVILDMNDTRAYWSVPLEQSGGNSLPDCRSEDAITGAGTPGVRCASCEYSKFGSDGRGDRQACKLTREVLFLPQGHTLPVIVQVPPSSIEAARKYVMRLASFGLHFRAVITILTLEKVQNKQGISYSKVKFTCIGPLTAEQRAQVRDYLDILRPNNKRRRSPGEPQTFDNVANETSVPADGEAINE